MEKRVSFIFYRSFYEAIALLEPSIIVVMAVLVVLILFAVYLPMFSMYGNM